MVFSAVALVAFSFAGMANNEVKEVENKVAIEDCEECYAYADSLDNGRDRSNQQWMINVDNCRASNGCERQYTKLIKSVSAD